MAGPSAKAFADLVDLIDTMNDHLGAISEEEFEEEEVVTAGETATSRD